MNFQIYIKIFLKYILPSSFNFLINIYVGVSKDPATLSCPPHDCDKNANINNSTEFPCGKCICKSGWVGPGQFCGPDKDGDGWSDIALPCSDTR